MPSRVVHIRLDDWVLLGCYDILQAGGRETANLPSASVAREVLTGIVRNMQRLDQIPTYTDAERLARAREIYGGEYQPEAAMSPLDIVSDSFDEDDEPEEIDISQVAKSVQDQILGNEPPVKEVQIADTVEPVRLPKINLLALKSERSWAEIKKESPKDRLVEWATTLENEIAQKAVAIIYSGLPKELWGSERAEKQLMQLIERHDSEDD